MNQRSPTLTHHHRYALAALCVLLGLSSGGTHQAMAFSVMRNPSPSATSLAPSNDSSSANTCNKDRVLFGTAAISKADDPHSVLDAAYAKGFRRFDLARTYGAGQSEIIFGEWMTSRNIDRSEVDIITKGGMGEDKYGTPDRPLLEREGLMREIATSLEALQTDSVDLYMFHRDDPRIPASQFVEWANEVVDAGQANRWGVSNWSFDRFREAYDYATKEGLAPPSANSPQFSLAVPRCEVWPTSHSISGAENLPQIEWYRKHDIELLCWEVLAKGFIAQPNKWPEAEVDTSTFDHDYEMGTDEWRLQQIQKAYCNKDNYRRRRIAVKLAEQHGLKLSQVATLFALSTGKHISVIFGSTNERHIDDMMGLQDLFLDAEAMSCLTGKKAQLANGNIWGSTSNANAVKYSGAASTIVGFNSSRVKQKAASKVAPLCANSARFDEEEKIEKD